MLFVYKRFIISSAEKLLYIISSSNSIFISEYSTSFEKLMKYYIFRYLLKALYDYDILTKVKYGCFACIVISRIYSYFETLTFEKRVEIMYSFSKEIEYSDMNMELLDEMMYSNFSAEDIINLL